MIIVTGTLTIPPADMPDFAEAVSAMRPHVLAEDGCLGYVLAPQDAQAGLVLATEMWRDDAALLEHFRQPWIIAFMARFGAGLLASTVQVYDVANVRPLPQI